MSKIEGEYDFEIIEIEAGEVNKNIATCTQVGGIVRVGLRTVTSALINLGGCVVTDLGGFGGLLVLKEV